jgi:hypothetical protein
MHRCVVAATHHILTVRPHERCRLPAQAIADPLEALQVTLPRNITITITVRTTSVDAADAAADDGAAADAEQIWVPGARLATTGKQLSPPQMGSRRQLITKILVVILQASWTRIALINQCA